MTIDSFSGKYRFLSNFFPAPVEFMDLKFPSSEHAYQYMKNPNDPYAQKILNEGSSLSPSQVKRLSRKIKLSDDWSQKKDDIMFHIVLSKFQQNKHLKNFLLQTGDQELIEGNTWGDVYWGVCNGVGENRLGKILMKVREILND